MGLCSTCDIDISNLYLNSFCFGYRITDSNILNFKYLNYLLKSKLYRKKIVNLGQGSTRFNISKNQIMNIKIKIPNVFEQDNIVKILLTIKNKITNEENKLSNLKSLKASLLQQMFI